ncbi:heparinase II/III family protein [Pedobacter sp. MC2016-24]|uniref:heparinase II/III domain-containing protein n=1 Tax=Pedobacter sp. MC2016-24 TaxID=2780090 RepID=UPI00188292E1|nr:heparinase II/III family protein [Pedobacter sp. MC2016-24]MBE9599816.1 heparinase II/III family protein [Pedobacter sp. MC2016-24]
MKSIISGVRQPIFFVITIVSLFSFSKGLSQQADKVKSHPYLLYTTERINHVKEQIKRDSSFYNSWNGIKSKADQSICQGKGVDIEGLALAYRMTGERRYAEQAKRLLIQLTEQKGWDGMEDRTPEWNSGLGTAHKNFLTAVTFDAIYDVLSSEERRTIANGIVALGIKPSLADWLSHDQRIHSINSMGHNWWSSIVFQAGMASLAVMTEIPEAKSWAEDVILASKEWFGFSGSILENKPSNFDSAGGFYESVSYANFGIGEYLMFRVAWTNAFSPIKMPYDQLLEKTITWFMDISYPNSGALMSLNFGDSNPYANGDRLVKLMLALGFKNKNYNWYLNHLGNSRHKEDLRISTPLGLLYSPGRVSSPESPELPRSAIYPDMGWAMLRSSWDKNATLLGVKSGFTWNHAHADAGSFILYHSGKNILIDGGNVSYGDAEYSAYSVRSEVHNVMLFNGKAQNSQDQHFAVKNSGHLYHLMDAGGIKYILADAQGPTAQNFLKNYRSFFWIGDVILVIDDVKAYEQGRFEWLLHYANTIKKKGIDLEIENDSALVLVRPLFPETLPNGYPHDFPEKMRLEERMAIKDHDAKTKLPYFAIYPPENYSQTKFINAIILLWDQHKAMDTFTGYSGAVAPSPRTNLPQIEKLEGKNYIGVKITQKGKVTELYFNLLADGRLMHRNSNNAINGWETDAYLMALTYNENVKIPSVSNVERYFVANGSYLRKANETVLHSLSKVFMVSNYKNGTAEVVLQGQPTIRADLKLNTKPAQLNLNAKTSPVIYKDGKLVLNVN